MALSLYNKYRPQTFSDVVGQHHVETTLANAVEKGTVSHAYLFCGPRGTGKTTTARILAKALLCKDAPTDDPCGTCAQCLEISNGTHPDVYELDAASRTGVDNVREEIIGRVNYAPTQGTHKIYIIDEVHMLSTPAFNALLKTLEEPPSHVVFVLCTTDVHKVPDTVQARCQRFDFKRLGAEEIVGRLHYICEQEGFECQPSALELIAQRSQGGMRDAIRSLEQTAVFSNGNLTYEAAESLLGMVDSEQLFALGNAIATTDAAACFDWVASYVQSGSDIAILVNDLANHIRNLFVVSVANNTDKQLIDALELEPQQLEQLRQQATLFASPEQLSWILQILGALSAELKNAANARLALEVALTRMLNPQSTHTLEALEARVAKLEAQLASGAVGGGAQAGVAAPAANTGTHYAVVDETKAEDFEATSAPAPKADASLAAPTQQDTAGQQAAPASATSGDSAVAATASASANTQAQQGAVGGQALHRLWDSVVDTIKNEKRGVAASLGGITPVLGAGGKRLTLELPHDAATSKQYLETEANKKLIQTTVAKIFGEPLEVQLVLAANKGAGTQQQASTAQASASAQASNAAQQPAPPQAAFTTSNTGSTAQAENFKEEPRDQAPLYEKSASYDDSPPYEDDGFANTAEEAMPVKEGAAAQNTTSHSPSSSEPSKDELEAILGNSFSENITFKENDA